MLRELGIRIVLVHGGEQQTTTLCERLGIDTPFVGGRRVTSATALEAAIMGMNGTVQTSVLATFRRVAIPAVGLSGIDTGLVQAVKRPPRAVEHEGRVLTCLGRSFGCHEGFISPFYSCVWEVAPNPLGGPISHCRVVPVRHQARIRRGSHPTRRPTWQIPRYRFDPKPARRVLRHLHAPRKARPVLTPGRAPR